MSATPTIKRLRQEMNIFRHTQIHRELMARLDYVIHETLSQKKNYLKVKISIGLAF